jgi:hypothetical protein
MEKAVLFTAFLLTVLSVIGLMFFIKASVKERIEQAHLISQENADSLLITVKKYFSDRSYQITAADPNQNKLTFMGTVRPSWFMAIFLTCLAIIGFLCLGLSLSMLQPDNSRLFFSLVLLSPGAGIFYWQRAQRPEKISLQLDGILGQGDETKSLITVIGHRDELIHLTNSLNLKPYEVKN